MQLFQGHHKTFANLQGFDANYKRAIWQRLYRDAVFLHWAAWLAFPSAASCENGRLSTKEDIACVTSARSHVRPEKLAKSAKNDAKPHEGGGIPSPKTPAFSSFGAFLRAGGILKNPESAQHFQIWLSQEKVEYLKNPRTKMRPFSPEADHGHGQ